MRTVWVAVILLLSVCAVLPAADSPAGTWKIVTTGPGPTDEFHWTFNISDAAGKLTGKMAGDMGEFELADLKFEGGTLTGKITIEANTYSISVKVSGDKMEGGWKGITGSESGTVKGSRQA